MRGMRILCAIALLFAFSPLPAFAKNEKDTGKPEEKQAQQEEKQAEQQARRAERQDRKTVQDRRAAQEEQRVQQEDRKEARAENLKRRQNRNEEPGDELNNKGKKIEKTRSSLEHARWSSNPHDDRGQGNMGKPAMQDPFGHDKDSGRTGSERGRPKPVQDPVFVPEPLPVELPPEQLPFDASVDFSMLGAAQGEWIMNWFQSVVEGYASDPVIQKYYTYEQYYTMWYKHFFPGGDPATSTGIRMADTTYGVIAPRIDYAIDVNNAAGSSLIVTTTFTAAEDYIGKQLLYDPVTRTYKTAAEIQYASGDVMVQNTQELKIDSATGTANYSYVLPDTIYGYMQNECLFVNMEVTVTDPVSGASYSQTYDRQLYLYRCPYGTVSNAKTRLPIAGAKITVHYEDGSLVELDKAANPHSKNPQVTDASGRYGCKLEGNRRYYIAASAPGYNDYKSEVFTEKWHVLREDISLEPVTLTAANK